MKLRIGQLLTLTFLLHGTCSGFVTRDTEEVSIFYPDATFHFLQERTNVRVCEYVSVQHLANCVTIVAGLQAIGIALGNAAKSLSNSNSQWHCRKRLLVVTAIPRQRQAPSLAQLSIISRIDMYCGCDSGGKGDLH
ncbi:hypothetical protein FSST1_005247 [Fusarium sambucinum]